MGVRPSGTVTFLFTDIEGSTRLWDEHPGAMREALARHDEILRAAIVAHEGFVFSSAGDGVAAAFHGAGDAVAAAIDAQRRLQVERWPEPVGIRVRMGAHTGEAQERDGDYFGPPVNRAARIMSAGLGGQILVSAATAAVLSPVPGVELVDLGSQVLRGVAEPLRVFGVRADGLEWVDQPLATLQGAKGNLPRSVNEFVGRSAELKRLAAELPWRRVVTLTGVGGVGKTRLAVEAAWQAADEFPDGVWLVELAPVADPKAVAPAVAAMLSIRPQEGMSMVEAVADWMRGRRLLLVVDNCEHVLGAAAALVEAVTAAATVTVLATSRELLGLRGEHVHAVASLDPLLEGVELFCDRARAANDAFGFSDDDISVIGRLCERLDGIPLAIELAAGRARSMTAADLLARIDDRFRLLRGGGRGGLERHQTLRATVAWSYNLLSESERLLFDRCSVFAGSFDVAAAEAVCADDDLDPLDVVDVLGSLVDRSMIVADVSGGSARFRLLETLRQYGEERLGERGDPDAVRGRHLAYYAEVAARWNPVLATGRELDAHAVFDRDWDNLRAAHSWAITTGDLDAADRVVASCGPHAYSRLRHDHADWARRNLTLISAFRTGSPLTYGWAAYWAWILGDYEVAIETAHHGIGSAPSPDHPDTVVCWIAVALPSNSSVDLSEAIGRLNVTRLANPDPNLQFLAIEAQLDAALWGDQSPVPELLVRLADAARLAGSPSMAAEALYYEGMTRLAAAESDPAAAFGFFREALELARNAHNTANEGVCLAGIALCACALDTPDATEWCREAITRLYDIRYWSMVWVVLRGLASYWHNRGAHESAAVVLGHPGPQSAVLAENDLGRRWREGADALGAQRRAAGWIARGAAMDRDELIAFALDQLDTMAPRS